MKAGIGTHIELHPATDLWMMGDRRGVITGIDKTSGVFRVKLAVSGKTTRLHPDNVGRIGDVQVTHVGQGNYEVFKP